MYRSFHPEIPLSPPSSRCFVRYESLVKFKVIKDIKKLFPSDWPTNYLPHVERSGKRWLLCRFLLCSSSAGLTDTLYPRLWCDSLAREFRQQPDNGKEKWFAGWKKRCRNIMEVRCEPIWNEYQAHSAPARQNLRKVGTGEEEEGGRGGKQSIRRPI